MNMLSWAVYVSDYSRYLPRNTSAAADLLGGVRRQRARHLPVRGPEHLHHGGRAQDRQPVVAIGSIAGKWILPILALSLLGSDALNAYTGMLALESVRSTFQKVVASRTARGRPCW